MRIDSNTNNSFNPAESTDIHQQNINLGHSYKTCATYIKTNYPELAQTILKSGNDSRAKTIEAIGSTLKLEKQNLTSLSNSNKTNTSNLNTHLKFENLATIGSVIRFLEEQFTNKNENEQEIFIDKIKKILIENEKTEKPKTEEVKEEPKTVAPAPVTTEAPSSNRKYMFGAAVGVAMIGAAYFAGTYLSSSTEEEMAVAQQQCQEYCHTAQHIVYESTEFVTLHGSQALRTSFDRLQHGVTNVETLRRGIENVLPEIFNNVSSTFQKC